MPDVLVISLAALVLDDINFLPFLRPHHIRRHRRSFDNRRPNFRLTFPADEQYAIESDRLLVGVSLAVDEDGIAAGHLKLLALFINDRVHGRLSLKLNSSRKRA